MNFSNNTKMRRFIKPILHNAFDECERCPSKKAESPLLMDPHSWRVLDDEEITFDEAYEIRRQFHQCPCEQRKKCNACELVDWATWIAARQCFLGQRD